MADEPEAPFADEDAEETAPQAPSAADRGSQKRIRDRVKRERAEAVAFWKGVFGSEIGRREMWSILAVHHAFEARFANGPNGFPQSEATWYRLGERDMAHGLYISWRKLDPQGVWLMQQEHDPALKPEPKPKRQRRDNV